MREPRSRPRKPEPDKLDESGAANQESAAINLAHLAGQCLDDWELATELLSQFRSQSLALAAQLAGDDRLSQAKRADIAHLLRGSALAVGAPAVARAAERVEACGRAGAEGPPGSAATFLETSRAISTLSEAVEHAVAEIDRLMK